MYKTTKHFPPLDRFGAVALPLLILLSAVPVEAGKGESKKTPTNPGADVILQDGQNDKLISDLVGEYIDGTEAERIGLVNRAVPGEQLMETVMEMAAKIAANSMFSLKMIKKGLNMALGEVSLEALMDFEVEACLACVSTKERQESLQEFEDRKK